MTRGKLTVPKVRVFVTMISSALQSRSVNGSALRLVSHLVCSLPRDAPVSSEVLRMADCRAKTRFPRRLGHCLYLRRLNPG